LADAQQTLRVDPEGRIDEIGRAVERRLRDRPGRYVLVPGPRGLLVLRQIEPPTAGGPRVLLAGEIAGEMGAVEVLGIVSSTQWKGELDLVSGSVRRSIFFEGPVVRWATSSHPSDRLGEILIRAGVASRQEIEAALAKVSPDRHLGQVLVESGRLTQAELFEQLKHQVEEIIYAAMQTREGTFQFVEGFGTQSLHVTVHIAASHLLMEGVRRMDEMQYFRARIPDSSVIPVRHAPKAGAKIDANGEKVLSTVDGLHTLADIARETGLGEFETTKTLYHLLQGGFVELGSGPPPDGIRMGAVVDDFNEVLAEILRATAEVGKVGEATDFMETFIGAWGSYRELFAGAGPNPEGKFDRAKILENLAVAPVDNRSELLYHAFNEYLCFALFSAGSLLKRGEEQRLTRRINDLLARLKP
jgi:hypothetical protein